MVLDNFLITFPLFQVLVYKMDSLNCCLIIIDELETFCILDNRMFVFLNTVLLVILDLGQNILQFLLVVLFGTLNLNPFAIADTL